MIVAVERGGGIGWADGRLPWKLPADMKRFKTMTTGQRVVMGFNTFKSLCRPTGLPNRHNIVLSRRFSLGLEVDTSSSLEWVVKSHLLDPAGMDLWIIGGSSVYFRAIASKVVDEIHLTVVDTDSGCDVVLPFELAAWKLFVLQQAKHGVNWTASEPQHVREGDIDTTYIVLSKS